MSTRYKLKLTISRQDDGDPIAHYVEQHRIMETSCFARVKLVYDALLRTPVWKISFDDDKCADIVEGMKLENQD